MKTRGKFKHSVSTRHGAQAFHGCGSMGRTPLRVNPQNRRVEASGPMCPVDMVGDGRGNVQLHGYLLLIKSSRSRHAFESERKGQPHIPITQSLRQKNSSPFFATRLLGLSSRGCCTKTRRTHTNGRKRSPGVWLVTRAHVKGGQESMLYTMYSVSHRSHGSGHKRQVNVQ